jgi:uncharacterized protein (DUF2147 family)
MRAVSSIRFVAILLSAGIALAADGASGADAILGRWSFDNGRDRAHIEISRAGEVFEGRIVWLERPSYPLDDALGMGGQAKMDRRNPDPNLRTRPILGLKILEGLRYNGGHEWTGGRVYAPDEGRSYKGKAWLDGGVLKVRGYVGFSFLGRTMEWPRVSSSELAPTMAPPAAAQ